MVFTARERIVERAEQLRQPAIGDAFVDMRIPAVERERADARTVGLRQKFRGIAGGLGEIGAHLAGTGTAGLLRHIARVLDGRASLILSSSTLASFGSEWR